ncbi:MAG: hypothetical protein JWL71_3015 [Acidobacteria bacterium]|nr:hypothetical protein [Acidobacteriota bacterium]
MYRPSIFRDGNINTEDTMDTQAETQPGFPLYPLCVVLTRQ